MISKFKIVLLFLFVSSLHAADYRRLLLHGNCITCHHIEKSISAPSMRFIKKRYLLAFPDKKDFISYMSEWVLKPNKENSIMHDMIDKYKLMPELVYDKNTLEEISEYIYEADL